MQLSYADRVAGGFAWRGLLRRIVTLFTVLVLAAGCATTGQPDIDLAPITPGSPDKYAAMVIDASNGTTLYEVNSTAQRYPASLTKMMTLYLLFEAMEQGRLSKTTQIPFSANAARQPPSKMGVKAGESIDVETAILAIAVRSGNDVAVAVAEYLGGSEEQFAAQMTARARGLGMTGTTFRNASGLPDPGQTTTARDMALLGMALRQRFPQYFHYFSNKNFVFRGRTVEGRNDMLGRVEGVNGIKTGYIRASGYNIVTSVTRGSRQLIVVVMGGDSARARNAHVEQLIEQYIQPRGLAPSRNLLGALSPFD